MATGKLKRRKTKRDLDQNLNAQQVLFAETYVANGLKGTDAARAAGYKNPAVAACKNLSNPKINAYISSVVSVALDKVEITRDEVIQQLKYALTRSGDDFVDAKTGELLPIHKMSARAKACIDGFEQEVFERETEEGVQRTVKTKVKLLPKASALEMSMKYLALYPKEATQPQETNVQINIGAIVDNVEKARKMIIDADFIESHPLALSAPKSE